LFHHEIQPNSGAREGMTVMVGSAMELFGEGTTVMAGSAMELFGRATISKT
jgi:hypothetical protein